jgi:hypothetical protein
MAARGIVVGVSAVLLLAGACDEAEQGSFEGVTLRSSHINGMRLNGMRLNGMRLNGMRLNGDTLNGDTVDDYIKVLEIDLHGMGTGVNSWLVGSQLHVQSSSGPTLTGVDLEKTVIEFDVKETGKGKKNKTVKVLKVGWLSPGSDVAVYKLDLHDGTWQSFCEGNTDVIMLGDLWDPADGGRIAGTPDDAVTFACRGDALAKCVEFGYRPWATVAGVSLRDYHQACTRMVRADYCGDGVAHTVDGTAIHVLDELGIQAEDPNADYVVEAEWGPDGATCLNAGNTRLPDQAIGCELPACGDSFASDGLIQSGTLLSL